MVYEKQLEVSRRYYNYQFACPTYGMKGEDRYFQTPLSTDKCPCCKRPKGSNSDTECDFNLVEF